MNKLAIVLIAVGGLLSGCVAYEDSGRDRGVYRGDPDGEHHRVEREHEHEHEHERDRDGEHRRDRD
jgi:hypothetical protein